MIVVKGERWRRANAVSLQKEALSRPSAPVGAPDYGQVGIRVNWMIGNSSCAEAQKLADFGCLSINSDCVDDPLRGYVCHCQSGYEGNPYMPNGCQDIDECSARCQIQPHALGDA